MHTKTTYVEAKVNEHSRASSYMQRLEMVTCTAAGASDADAATLLTWSRWTVRKWRRAARAHGNAGLVSHMGARSVGVLGRSPQALREAILDMRNAHPGGGPQTILQELLRDARFAERKLPSRSALAAFLKAQHKTRGYHRHTQLQQAPVERSTCAHEEWELDAKGAVAVAGLAHVCLIDIIDTYSRVSTESLAVGPTHTPSCADYQLACRRAFTRFGLPRRITLDHDTVFIESTCPSPFPRRLHLWLLGLGIEVRFIVHPPPREHSLIERLHRTLGQQALTGDLPTSWAALNAWLTQRRIFINAHYPTAAGHNQPPLLAHPEASHSGRGYTPQMEAELLDLERIDAYLAQHAWYRPVTPSGQVWIHDARYNVGRPWAGHTLGIRFDPATRHFTFHAEDEQLISTLPARNLTHAYLMGELPPWSSFPAHQLHLPLSNATLREAALYAEMRGIT